MSPSQPGRPPPVHPCPHPASQRPPTRLLWLDGYRLIARRDGKRVVRVARKREGNKCAVWTTPKSNPTSPREVLTRLAAGETQSDIARCYAGPEHDLPGFSLKRRCLYKRMMMGGAGTMKKTLLATVTLALLTSYAMAQDSKFAVEG